MPGVVSNKKDIALQLDKDILCLTETHAWGDNSNDIIYSEKPPKSDSWSGGALLVSKRISGSIVTSGSVGSRIVFCRLKGNITNYFVIGIYIP